MEALPQQIVTLNLHADMALLPVATSFAETGCSALGLAQSESLALTLATEEVFSYLCQVAAPGRQVQIALRRGSYYVEEEWLFEARDFNMQAFNVTAQARLDESEGPDETGLLIASRMVDRFRFSQEDRALRLVLIKERSYPPGESQGAVETPLLTNFAIRPPDHEELKIFVNTVRQLYPAHLAPRDFAFPGKVVDMTTSRELSIAIATDRAGHIGGGICQHSEGNDVVEFFGPYVFGQPQDSAIPQALVDFIVAAQARTRTKGLICRYPTAELPKDYFEPLGSLTFHRQDGSNVELEAHYRHFEEDSGVAVWAHPCCEAFLTKEFRRLVFAREIRRVTNGGESKSTFSVLSTEVDRGAGRVTLRPVWWGEDAEPNLAAHVGAFLAEGIRTIFFEMDIGRAWHCHFGPALLSSGFEPRLVVPHGGKGDLVVFQQRSHDSAGNCGPTP